MAKGFGQMGGNLVGVWYWILSRGRSLDIQCETHNSVSSQDTLDSQGVIYWGNQWKNLI